ncbi:MAG: isochorismatase family protein [Chloroflexi bacterium]|nr:isochorismatase family protein [Chloroflexota bacterium]
MRPWQQIVPPEDRAIFEKAGFGHPRPFGQHPALLVVDVVRTFVGSRPMPVLEAIEEYRTSCGIYAWEALPHIRRLLGAARRLGLPVAYTYGKRGSGTTKRKAEDSAQHEAALGGADQEFPPEIVPLPGERIVAKPMASAFFQTGLAEELRAQGVDCILATGDSTSGCVRASVVDGHSHGFAMFVVEEGCFDRSRFFHLASLFDMHQKYATVITVEEALSHLSRLGVTAGTGG